MPVSKFNQEWFNTGRRARFKAEKVARLSGALTVLPESSYRATAHQYWRHGWNSVTRQELEAYLNNGETPQRLNAEQHITKIRKQLGAHA